MAQGIRDRVPQGIIAPEQGEEEQGDQEEKASESCTDSEESSDEQDGSLQDNARTPLSEDIHQHGLMVVAYRDVGNEYTVDRGQLRKGLKALQDFESVPRRWPLARLTVPLLKSVDHLDRVLAGCCSEVLITRKYPDDSLGALRQAARSLAQTLRGARTSQGAPLTDEENTHLLGANYWVQPIYQELLHAASGHNASVEGERKGWSKLRLSRGKPEPVLLFWTQRVSDWIGGFCPADSLMIWFPAHWAPQVIKELRREQDHRKRFPQWFDDRVPNKYWQQQQDARASRTLHFQKRPYLASPIQLLTASIRVDWFSLPVQCFLDRMPQLRQGLIRGVFQTKASSPWGGNK